MKLNHKLILTGPALLLTVIAYACMRPADSISGTAFPLQRVIFPSLICITVMGCVTMPTANFLQKIHSCRLISYRRRITNKTRFFLN